MDQIKHKTVKHNPAWRYLIYALCGAVMAIPYSVDRLWFLAWITFIPVLILEYSFDNDCKHPYFAAYRRGFCFFYPYGIILFFWFFDMYPLEFLGIGKGAALCVVLLGVFGLSLLQAIVWALFFCVLHFVRSRKNGSFGSVSLFIAPFCWIAFEWVQSQTWAGVPWGKLALGQVRVRSVIQSISLFGPYFVSFLIILFSVLFAFAFITLRKERNVKKSVLLILIAIVLFSCNYLYGSYRVGNFHEEGRSVKVSAIQGNIDSKEKWSNDISFTLETYDTLTREAAKQGAEIVVWPETAIPVCVLDHSDIKKEIENLSTETECTVFVGAFTEATDGQLENSILKAEPQMGFSDEHYVKRRLVPFGEFVPWRNFIMTVVPPLNELTIIGDDLAVGKGAQLIETEYGKIGAIICFDSIYESLSRESVAEGAELLCVSTNDSWFGDSSAVYEHNSHSILRAVENGRYVVRAANTGISSVISPTGEIMSSIEPLVRGQLTNQVEMLSSMTLYTRIGNVIVLLAFAIIFIVCLDALFFDRRRRNGR